jgi:hypothetical protein
VEGGMWVGVNAQCLLWFIMVDVMVDGLCLWLISGGSKCYAVGAMACSIKMHGCLKGDVSVEHMYMLAGDGKGRTKPSLMLCVGGRSQFEFLVGALKPWKFCTLARRSSSGSTSSLFLGGI